MCHVLIIEDEALIALDLEDLLQRNGAQSFSFADSQQGAIEESRINRPDFILSDVALTEGTGPLAVEAIRSELGAIPVIFVTATPEACSPCAPPGKVFRKPLDRPAIGAAFRRMRAA
ncbi:response regulator [Sphingomonas naphthae]|uniref:Response regulator n=1 Tax=Sphingomonas naphthae TaxID=1813468 RepID=A0ABY7TG71_9SPHN|nr:response regulator [Sphingomonas naphthae]WCT72228.1 response regulator [Sphingomonas naphthae]